jgi:carbamoyl-phosphate synthase large subunit
MMRRLAIDLQIPYITTLTAAKAAVGAIKKIRGGTPDVKSLNDYFAKK